jgi:hypothetical protein
MYRPRLNHKPGLLRRRLEYPVWEKLSTRGSKAVAGPNGQASRTASNRGTEQSALEIGALRKVLYKIHVPGIVQWSYTSSYKTYLEPQPTPQNQYFSPGSYTEAASPQTIISIQEVALLMVIAHSVESQKMSTTSSFNVSLPSSFGVV